MFQSKPPTFFARWKRQLHSAEGTSLFLEEWSVRDSNQERERGNAGVTDDGELNHAANLLGGWGEHFTCFDICFDNCKMKA